MFDRPWPVRGRTSWIIAAVLLALFGACGLALGVAAASTERVGLLLVGSPLLLVAAVLVYLSRARRPGVAKLAVRHVQDLGEPGVVLPYSAALGWGYVAAVGYCGLFFGLIAAGGAASLVGGAASLGGSAILLVVALLVCGYLLWCVVDMLRGRLRLGLVALTPHGIYHRSWAMRAYLPWTEVVAVTATDVRGPLVQVVAAVNTSGSWIQQTSRTWRQSELAFAPHLAVQGRFLAVEPSTLYGAARFYSENPAARAELATEAAVTRLRTGHR